MRAIIGWWASSLTLFVVLFPSDYKFNLGLLVLILLSAAVLAYLGFSRSASQTAKQIAFLEEVRPAPVLIASSALLMIAAGLARAQDVGFTTNSISDAIGDLGVAYSNRKELQATSDTGSTGTFIVSGLFFLFPFAVPLSILQWGKLSNWLRALVVMGVLSYGGYFLAGGTMKGFGDLALLLVIGLLARSARRRYRGDLQGNSGHRLRWALALTATMFGFLWLITAAMASRLEGNTARLPLFRPDGSLGKLLGPYWSPGVETMLAYVSNGYLGLGLSLEYSPPYGMYGGFRGVSDLLSRYLGFEDAYAQSLPFVVESGTGYSATVNWWTVFPWLASDMGWLGAVLFVGGAGLLAGRLWVNIVYREDALSIGLFFFVLMFLAYVPANNQVFMSSSTTIGSIVLLLAYFARALSRKGRRAPGGQQAIPVRRLSLLGTPAVSTSQEKA